jgi:uncharacterized Zn-binding protein involved in type VI secretion
VTGQLAARRGDAVAHSDALFGFGLGGAVGLAAGIALLTVATGGADLLLLAAAGGAVALAGGGALAGMKIGGTYGDKAGSIVSGSPTILINGQHAARTLGDVAVCDNHAGSQQIATGSTTVFFNRMPAARLGDATVCDAHIASASANVIIGGGTAAYAAIHGEVPELAVTIARDMAIGGTAIALGAGAGAAYAAAGWAGVGVFGLQAGGGFAGGMVGGALGGAIGQAVGGAQGQAWGEVLGGTAGGLGTGAVMGQLGAGLTSTAGTVPGEQILQVRPAEEVNAEMVAAGNDPAWQPGTMVTTKTVPAGTNYNMVMTGDQADAVASGQPAYGGWASGDAVDSQSAARDGLAISPDYKPDVSYVGQVQTTAPQTINSGTVGPQGDLPGGSSQVQFLGDRNLQSVNAPQPLQYNNPSYAPSQGTAAGTAGAGALGYGGGDPQR